jgi:hypothetical protein
MGRHVFFLKHLMHINASWTSDWVDCKWKHICLESNLKHDHRDCQCLEPTWQKLRSAEVDLGAKQKKHQAETSNRAREVGSWRKQKSQTILSPGHVYPCITYGMDSFELQINLSDCVHFAIKKRSWSARFTKFTGRPRRTSSSALASAASSSRLAFEKGGPMVAPVVLGQHQQPLNFPLQFFQGSCLAQQKKPVHAACWYMCILWSGSSTYAKKKMKHINIINSIIGLV